MLDQIEIKFTNFERAVFFSWYCKLRDCSFCFMSTQATDTARPARRSTPSILAEVIIIKNLGWDFGFFSGGIGAYHHTEFHSLLKQVVETYGSKIWINAGPLSREELELYKPYILGVVGSIETVNPEIHKKVCPSKPVDPYLAMFRDARMLGLKRAITIIIGLGETIDDFPHLARMIEIYGITKIHLYCLNPQKGTLFEKSTPPTAEYQAEWIRKTREAFPAIDIQCGIWEDKIDRVALLLTAGANSISKFPAIKLFGSAESHKIEQLAADAGYRFRGTLTQLPSARWYDEVERLPFDEDLKQEIHKKLQMYLRIMSKHRGTVNNKYA